MLTYAPGTILARPKGFLTHYGIVTERGTIFHNTPERGEHESSIEEFAANLQVAIHSRVVDGPSFLWRLNQRRLARQPYHAISNNCEHTISALAGEVPASPQLQGWGILIGAIAAVALVTG